MKRVKGIICDNTYKGFLLFMSRVYSGTHPIKSSTWQKRLVRNSSVIFMGNLPNAAVCKRADGRINLTRKKMGVGGGGNRSEYRMLYS